MDYIIDSSEPRYPVLIDATYHLTIIILIIIDDRVNMKMKSNIKS